MKRRRIQSGTQGATRSAHPILKQMPDTYKHASNMNVTHPDATHLHVNTLLTYDRSDAFKAQTHTHKHTSLTNHRKRTDTSHTRCVHLPCTAHANNMVHISPLQPQTNYPLSIHQFQYCAKQEPTSSQSHATSALLHSKANGATVQRIRNKQSPKAHTTTHSSGYTKTRAQYKAARSTCAVPAKTRPSQSKSPFQNKAKPCNHRVFAKQGK